MSTEAAPEEKMQAMSLEESNKGTAKRDALRANEIAVQKMWEDERAFESEPDDREHFLVTFPYRTYHCIFSFVLFVICKSQCPN